MDAAKKEDLVDFGLANHIEGTPEGSVGGEPAAKPGAVPPVAPKS
jgi:hypothetical protein